MVVVVVVVFSSSSSSLFYFIFSWDKVSLCSPDCPGTYYVDQANLKLSEVLPASASAEIKGMPGVLWVKVYLCFSFIYCTYMYMYDYVCACVYVCVYIYVGTFLPIEVSQQLVRVDFFPWPGRWVQVLVTSTFTNWAILPALYLSFWNNWWLLI